MVPIFETLTFFSGTRLYIMFHRSGWVHQKSGNSSCVHQSLSSLWREVWLSKPRGWVKLFFKRRATLQLRRRIAVSSRLHALQQYVLITAWCFYQLFELCLGNVRIYLVTSFEKRQKSLNISSYLLSTSKATIGRLWRDPDFNNNVVANCWHN